MWRVAHFLLIQAELIEKNPKIQEEINSHIGS